MLSYPYIVTYSIWRWIQYNYARAGNHKYPSQNEKPNWREKLSLNCVRERYSFFYDNLQLSDSLAKQHTHAS